MQESKVKTLTAAVVSKSGDKSVTVAIDYKVKHPKYGKHNQSGVGDVVEIAQCRPLSKRKSWRLLKIVQKVEQA